MTALSDIKQVLMIGESDDSYDLDILMHFNTALAELAQLGVIEAAGLTADATTEWADIYSSPSLNMVRTLVVLKIRAIFDPPPNSFAVTAMQKQIDELVWRVTARQDEITNPYVGPEPEEED